MTMAESKMPLAECDSNCFTSDRLNERKRTVSEVTTDNSVSAKENDGPSVLAQTEENESTLNENSGGDRSRSSSPEIIHIKTIVETSNKKPAQRSEHELKRLFEVEYLENVLFKLHGLIDKESDRSQSVEANKEGVEHASSSAGEAVPSGNNGKDVGDINTDEPETKKPRLSNEGEVHENEIESDEEIVTIKTIEAPIVPGFSSALQAKFCDLWDLSCQTQVAEFMVQKLCYEPLKDIVMKTTAGLREIALGILANLSSLPEISEQCFSDTPFRDKLKSFFQLNAPKPDIQNQALKLLSFCIQNDESNWVAFLNDENIILKSLKFLEADKTYITEKIMENMIYICEASENLNYESDDCNVIELICKTIENYGIASKEERNVDTVFCLCGILRSIEGSRSASLFYRNSDLIMETLQTLVCQIDEKKYSICYCTCIERSVKLYLMLLKNFDSDKQLSSIKKFSKLTMCIVELLEYYEEEIEGSEFRSAVESYSVDDVYATINQCYRFNDFLSKLKDEVGEEKFFEGMCEELQAVIGSMFETYSSVEATDGPNGDESDNDIVEITSSSSSVQHGVQANATSEVMQPRNEKNSLDSVEGEPESRRSDNLAETPANTETTDIVGAAATPGIENDVDNLVKKQTTERADTAEIKMTGEATNLKDSKSLEDSKSSEGTNATLESVSGEICPEPSNVNCSTSEDSQRNGYLGNLSSNEGSKDKETNFSGTEKSQFADFDESSPDLSDTGL